MARVADFLNLAPPARNFALARDEQGNRTVRPPDLMYTALNDRLVAEIGTDRYLTIILADADPSTGVATLSLAGRPGPAIPRANGGIEYASSFGMPIGLIPNAEFSSFQSRLETRDRLCSDRIPKCMGYADDALLDDEGLEDLFIEVFVRRGLQFVEALQDGLSGVSGRADFCDDLSAAVLERLALS